MATTQSHVVFLKGKTTILRPIQKADVSLLVRWVNDPRIRQFVGSFGHHTEESEEKWVTRLIDDKANMVFIVALRDGTPIGTMGLHRIDWKDRIATTGAMLGEPKYWGKGYGTDAKMALLEYAFDELGLHKVCSTVISYNKRSLRYSLHCGYRIEGTRKSHIFKRGRYWDLVELGVFRRQWHPVWRHWLKTGRIR